MRRALRPAAVLVAVTGLAVAGYLTVVRLTGGEPACVVAHGCATVQASAYAELLGVPVAVLGVLGYAGILVALLVDGEACRTAAAGLALTGAGFSGWLTYVEVERLEAICAWCIVSAGCMAVLAVLCAVRMLVGDDPPRRRERPVRG